MSPRSSEFMEEARDRLEVARQVVKSGHSGSVVNAAYYAMPARRTEQAVEI